MDSSSALILWTLRPVVSKRDSIYPRLDVLGFRDFSGSVHAPPWLDCRDCWRVGRLSRCPERQEGRYVCPIGGLSLFIDPFLPKGYILGWFFPRFCSRARAHRRFSPHKTPPYSEVSLVRHGNRTYHFADEHPSHGHSSSFHSCRVPVRNTVPQSNPEAAIRVGSL